MKLIIVRHGETIENAAKIRTGHLDGKLSEKGVEQAKKLGLRLKNEKIDFVYCSDLGRTKETVEEILKFHEAPVVYDPLLRERCSGIFEGRPRKEFYEAVAKENFPDNLLFKPEKGETMFEVKERAEEFIERIRENHTNSETILVCTSAGWIHCFISAAFNRALDEVFEKERVENSSVNIFELSGSGNESIIINCTEHLK